MKRFMIILFCLMLLSGCASSATPSPVDNPEDGTYNLTIAPLTVSTDEVADHILYTNSTQITVQVQDDAAGTVKLYDVAADTLVGTCIFLTALRAVEPFQRCQQPVAIASSARASAIPISRSVTEIESYAKKPGQRLSRLLYTPTYRSPDS